MSSFDKNRTMDFYRNPHAPPPGLVLRDIGLLILRLGVATLIISFHAISQSMAGWAFFWKQAPWPLLDFIQAQGVPIPQLFAVLTVLILALGSLGILFGVLTRLSAFLLLLVVIGGIIFLFAAPRSEVFWLYGIAILVLALCGPGRFSLAYLLRRR